MTELQYEIDDLILLDIEQVEDDDDNDHIRCLIDCEDI